MFAPGCGREDDVGVFAGLIEENVLYGDEGDGVEGPSDFRKVRIRLGRVFADDVVGVNLFFRVWFTENLGRDAGEGQADFIRKGTAPGFFELPANGFVGYALIPRILMGRTPMSQVP